MRLFPSSQIKPTSNENANDIFAINDGQYEKRWYLYEETVIHGPILPSMLMVIVINAADDDFDIHSSDELPLFADKGDSGILAA